MASTFDATSSTEAHADHLRYRESASLALGYSKVILLTSYRTEPYLLAM